MGTEHQTMVKGSEVEVCSEEEGYKGAYFRAVLEENLTQSGRKKVSVRYKTLLSDDSSSPLTKTVQQSLLRPVPPPEEVVLEEGTVVDAYLRDGWWKGLIIKKMEEEGKEDDSYLVYFDSPPDIIMFDKTKLRAHVDWTVGSNWFRPDLKELDKSMFSPGTMVEVSSVIDKGEVAWFPAMLIKEIEVMNGEKKFIVKDCNQHLSSYGEEARPNTTVDSRRVRPKPPRPSSEEYKLMDCVEVFHGSVWRHGWVRGLLTEQCYEVCLEATKEKHVFTHSHVRPLKVWEDGAWVDRPKKETPYRSMKPKTASSKRRRKQVRGGSLNPDKNGETLTKAETVAAVTGEVSNEIANAVVMTGETSPPVITPQVTPIAKESASVVTPSPPDVAATPLKQQVTETEGQQSSEKTREPRSKQNGLGNDSTQQEVKWLRRRRLAKIRVGKGKEEKNNNLTGLAMVQVKRVMLIVSLSLQLLRYHHPLLIKPQTC
ncbi:Agenet-like domain-containing protein [Hirschfeldia incana]|nr:Agenet-like domain-containing protein [Hirschfeldia incana]